MKPLPPGIIALFCAAIILLSGCAGNIPWQPTEAQYHYQVPVKDPDGGTRLIDRWVVEFDEQGELHNKNQLTEALAGIQNTPGKILLLVFVHGWQNDASYATGDLRNFENHLLARVAASERVKRENFRVIGVYMGWRGGLFHTRANKRDRGDGGVNAADLLLSVPKTGSFFTRKSATQRLGNNVGLTDALYRVSEAARYERDNMTKRFHDGGISRVVMIGHSFGGAVLEEFLKTTIAARQPTARGISLSSPADLFLLVNSATEASNAQQFQTLLREYSPQAQDSKPPMVISISSEGDFPNRVAFWTAKHLVGIIPAINGAFKNQEGLYFGRTSGHVTQLLSHWARRATPAEIESNKLPAAEDAFEKNLDQRWPVTLEDGSKTYAFRAEGGKPLKAGERSAAGGEWWVLAKRDPRGNSLENNTRYWVVKVPNDIVKGHGGLYNEASYDLMAALFRIANPTPKGALDMEAPRMELLNRAEVPTQTEQYNKRTSVGPAAPPVVKPAPARSKAKPAPTPVPSKPESLPRERTR